MDDHTTRRRDELLDAIAWLRASILEDRQAHAAILEHADLAELVDDVTLICLDLLSEYRNTDSLLRLLDSAPRSWPPATRRDADPTTTRRARGRGGSKLITPAWRPSPVVACLPALAASADSPANDLVHG